jgi:hypothetical protein
VGTQEGIAVGVFEGWNVGEPVNERQKEQK